MKSIEALLKTYDQDILDPAIQAMVLVQNSKLLSKSSAHEKMNYAKERGAIKALYSVIEENLARLACAINNHPIMVARNITIDLKYYIQGTSELSHLQRKTKERSYRILHTTFNKDHYAKGEICIGFSNSTIKQYRGMQTCLNDIRAIITILKEWGMPRKKTKKTSHYIIKGNLNHWSDNTTKSIYIDTSLRATDPREALFESFFYETNRIDFALFLKSKNKNTSSLRIVETVPITSDIFS